MLASIIFAFHAYWTFTDLISVSKLIYVKNGSDTAVADDAHYLSYCVLMLQLY